MPKCYTKHVNCPENLECSECKIKPNNERVICCECGKNILKINSKKNPYNDNYNYCLSCFEFWFK